MRYLFLFLTFFSIETATAAPLQKAHVSVFKMIWVEAENGGPGFYSAVDVCSRDMEFDADKQLGYATCESTLSGVRVAVNTGIQIQSFQDGEFLRRSYTGLLQVFANGVLLDGHSKYTTVYTDSGTKWLHMPIWPDYGYSCWSDGDQWKCTHEMDEYFAAEITVEAVPSRVQRAATPAQK